MQHRILLECFKLGGTIINIYFKLGQLTGIIAGVITAMLWMLVMWDPTGVFTFSTGNFAVLAGSFAVIFVMVILSVIAIVASLKGHGGVLVVIFAVSFFPIGLWVLAIPHWIHWVGLSNIGFLMAGVLLWRFHPYERNSEDQSG